LNVFTISFDYGKKHMRKELNAATDLATWYGVAHERVRLHPGVTSVFEGSALTDPDGVIPEGHYEEESMKQTVVPNRNMVLLSLATAYAIGRSLDHVIYGAHAGDHAIYPDCRPEFADAMFQSIKAASDRKVTLVTPFVHLTKAKIAELGDQLNVPFQLTWSCYKGGAAHCGKCGTCVERREAFNLSNVWDPTLYLRESSGAPEEKSTQGAN
jgi:7-cyano-7-deazaguanine synthase